MNLKKNYFLIFIIIIYISCKDKNEFIKTPIVLSKIDSLNTKEQIEKFIQEKDTNFKDFELKSILELEPRHKMDSLNILLAKKLKINSSFEKVDLDNNGFTDIIATGGSILVEFDCYNFYKVLVMNYPNNNYKIRIKYLKWGESYVPKVEYINSMPILVEYNHKYKNEWRDNKIILYKSYLTYKFNNLIEFNNKPKNNNISKIEYETSYCYGTCPVYKLVLNKDSISIFNAIHYNFSKNRNIDFSKEEGTFTSIMDKNNFNNLEKILNYNNFENLNDNYTVYHTDDQTCNLKITYNNGKVKKIKDYGLVGTYGLKILYNEFDSLRFNQKWKRIK